MLCIIPTHSGDTESAIRLVQWLSDLGTVKEHQVLIVADKLSDPVALNIMRNILSETFRHAVLMQLREAAPGNQGANLLFKRALRQVQASQAGPFLWLHPDAVPLREGWLDAIAAAWAMLPKGKRFLGAHVPGPIPHMSAVGCYPPDAEIHAPNLVMAENNPFHLNAAPQVVPKMASTSLIVDSAKDPLGIDGAGEEVGFGQAVLWHGSITCKTGELIAALRKMPHEYLKALEIVTPAPQQNGTQEPQKFVVPEKALPVDRSAQQAASRAGSDGIPGDEIDTSTQIPKTAPPMVNPVKIRHDETPPIPPDVFDASLRLRQTLRNSPAAQMFPMAAGRIEDGHFADKHATAAALTTAAHEVSEAAVSPKEDFGLTVREQLSNIVTPANVAQFAAALADFRDKSPAQKAAVLASLREHGFKLVGRGKQKGRRK